MFLIVSSILFLLLSSFPAKVLSVYDPLSRPNNPIGVHILFPEEIEAAAKFVNSESGSWGYVTIPIQSTDRDRKKWQKFLSDASRLKVIPIIRVATFANGPNWAEPENFDLVDFANFLNDLSWPIANRYVIIFNEVNRSDEYGGLVSPENYADILINAIDIFKARSDKFFILPAGLDNAAANSNSSIKFDTYLNRMYERQPEVFNRLDGWTSHAYPNPGFSDHPAKSGNNKIDSFRYDLALVSRFTGKKLPVFITETGWSNEKLPNDLIGSYVEFALSNVWNDSNVIAVTPFLLKAGTPPFSVFSLLDQNNNPRSDYYSFAKFSQKGDPIVDNSTATATTLGVSVSSSLPPENNSRLDIAVINKLIYFVTQVLF